MGKKVTHEEEGGSTFDISTNPEHRANYLRPQDGIL